MVLRNLNYYLLPIKTMDVYTKFVMSIPEIHYSDRCYLILAYDQCDEEFNYIAKDIRKCFPSETYSRIEKRLLDLNLIYRTRSKTKLRLNYVWKDGFNRVPGSEGKYNTY